MWMCRHCRLSRKAMRMSPMTENSEHRAIIIRVGVLCEGIERQLPDTENICRKQCNRVFSCIFWRHGCTVQKIREVLGPHQLTYVNSSDEQRPTWTGFTKTEQILTRSFYSDCICIGTTGREGESKASFDSGNLTEAPQRIDNAVAARQHLLNSLSSGGARV